MTIAIKQYPAGTFQLNEEMDTWHCTHEDAEIERACCSGYDSEGNPSCGCHGQDAVMCNAFDCDGILDHEVEALFDRLEGGNPDEN